MSPEQLPESTDNAKRPSDTSRRDFLKILATGVGAAALAVAGLGTGEADETRECVKLDSLQANIPPLLEKSVQAQLEATKDNLLLQKLITQVIKPTATITKNANATSADANLRLGGGMQCELPRENVTVNFSWKPNGSYIGIDNNNYFSNVDLVFGENAGKTKEEHNFGPRGPAIQVYLTPKGFTVNLFASDPETRDGVRPLHEFVPFEKPIENGQAADVTIQMRNNTLVCRIAQMDGNKPQTPKEVTIPLDDASLSTLGTQMNTKFYLRVREPTGPHLTNQTTLRKTEEGKTEIVKPDYRKGYEADIRGFKIEKLK